MKALALVLLIGLIAMVGCIESTPPLPSPLPTVPIPPVEDTKPPEIPVTPPTPIPEIPQVHISNAVIKNIQSNSVDITCDTDLTATVYAKINDATYKFTSSGTYHYITITGLTPSTSYVAELSAYSESDSDSTILTFITLQSQYNPAWQGYYFPPYIPPPPAPIITIFWQGDIPVKVDAE